MTDTKCAKCGMVFKAGVAYGYACPRGNDCGLYAVMTDPIPRQDLRLPPPVGYVSRADYDALMARLEDAEAAQALVVERAAEAAYEADSLEISLHGANGIAERIRAFAQASGVAALAALRAERDGLKQKLISPDPYEDTAHPDDHAVNRFAAAMKGKLAAKRLQGRGGWQEPEVPNGYLSRLLREHVDKGDPVDVANFAMMVHQRGERIAPENEGASCKAIDDALTRLAAAEGRVAADMAMAGYVKIIEVEKLLCEKLGIPWSATGISIASMIDTLADRAVLATVTPPADTGEGGE